MSEKTPGTLKGVCILGLAVALALAALTLFLANQGEFSLFSSGRGGSGFSRALEGYDREAAGLSPREHNKRLDALEKKALDLENTLSVLKRRRVLARSENGAGLYTAAYSAAAVRARGLYPASGQIAAVAADSLILSPENPARMADGETADTALALTGLMAEGGLGELALNFAVYSGMMSDPATARALPRELFTRLCGGAEGTRREQYLVNAAIRTLLGGAAEEAREQINAIFEEAPRLDAVWLFGAEFFYDHGDFERAAELFAHFGEGEYLARQADALYLAGFDAAAPALWQAAAGSPDAEADPELRSRTLYNLAASSGPAEAESWLSALFQNPAAGETARVYALIRFSRLAAYDRALAILERADQNEALFALELLRRRSEAWESGKTVAAVWFLVNEHPADPRLAEWAAWYFDLQRRPEETAMLLAAAERNGINSPRFVFNRALDLIRSGDAAGAEKVLRTLGDGRYGGFWQAPANLALIAESRRNQREALELYETAAAIQAPAVNRLRARGAGGTVPMPPELRDAARIQLSVARCLRALGREAESRRALDYALDLDPDNIEAALQKRRLDSRGIL